MELLNFYWQTHQFAIVIAAVIIVFALMIYYLVRAGTKYDEKMEANVKEEDAYLDRYKYALPSSEIVVGTTKVVNTLEGTVLVGIGDTPEKAVDRPIPLKGGDSVAIERDVVAVGSSTDTELDTSFDALDKPEEDTFAKALIPNPPMASKITKQSRKRIHRILTKSDGAYSTARVLAEDYGVSIRSIRRIADYVEHYEKET